MRKMTGGLKRSARGMKPPKARGMNKVKPTKPLAGKPKLTGRANAATRGNGLKKGLVKQGKRGDGWMTHGTKRTPPGERVFTLPVEPSIGRTGSKLSKTPSGRIVKPSHRYMKRGA